MKQTKEELVVSNAKLETRIRELEDSDESRRTQFGKLLGLTGEPMYMTSSYRETTTKPPTWLKISFSMGELKASSDFSAGAEEKNRLEIENRELREKIAILEQPK